MVCIKFKSIEHIQKYYQEQLNKGNMKVFKDMKTSSGENFEAATNKMLIAEAKRLYRCIQDRIEAYYDNYSPRFYERTNSLRNALKFETSVQYDGNKRYIGLYFEDSLSWGQSVVDDSWNGYKPLLANYGFKDKSHDTPHFLGYKGFHFIEDGIQDWKQDLKHPVEVKIIGLQGKFDIAERMGYTFE